MKNKFEFRLDRLDAFRSALSRGVRTPLQKGRVIHGWALQMGAWLSKKYAPRPSARGPVASQRHGQTGSVFPLLHGVVRGRKAVMQTPAYLWRAGHFNDKIYYAHLPRKVSTNYAMTAFVKRGAANSFEVGTLRGHPRAVNEKRLKSFAPTPTTAKSARLGFVKMPTQAHASVRKRVDQTEESEVFLPLTAVEGSVAESHTKQGGVLMSRSDEHRLAPGVSASVRGGALGADFDDVLEEYFFRHSRLAPSGGTAFDPRLSPLWAGLKLPT
ncbi:MAG: hypothetical protein KGH75_13710 [Rhodospirillales bacterium]|nr:hypothetical protein [Rhodospirillales bacterium]